MYSKNLILLYFLSAFAFTCIRGITNGDEARLGQFPYAVAIIKLDSGYVCGGGIIGDKWILSAANCFTERDGHFIDNAKFEVQANTNNLFDELTLNPKITVPVEAVYIPQGYNSNTKQADIAVLKLDRSLDFERSGLQQLCIPPGNHNFYDVGVQAEVMGFGVNSYSKGGKLHYANVRIVSDSEFAKIPYDDFDLGEYHFLAKMMKQSNESYGMCYGDEGSPVVYKSAMILGVLTMPYDCDEREHPSIYTKVAPYLDFIRNAVKDVTTNIRVKRYS